MKPIDKTGWYDGIDNDAYQSTANFCTVPSLGASGAVEIMETCPAKFFTNSDLNPYPIEDEQPDEGKFDIGTAAHLALLELDQWDRRVMRCDYPSWASKDAKKDREYAHSAGLTPLLTKHADKIGRMRAALEASGLYAKWIKGEALAKKGRDVLAITERSYVLFLDRAGIALKCRPDVYLETEDEVVMVNYKTTGTAAPHAFEWRLEDMKYHQKEAFYRHVYHQITGRKVTRYVHLVQETKPPYLALAFEIGPESLINGAMLNGPAIARFAMCVKADKWPAYPPGDRPDGTHLIETPVSARMKFEERKERGDMDLTPDADATMKALWYAAQAPDNFKLPRV